MIKDRERVTFTGIVTYRSFDYTAQGSDAELDSITNAMRLMRNQFESVLADLITMSKKGVPKPAMLDTVRSMLTHDYRSALLSDAKIDRIIRLLGLRMAKRYSPLTGRALIQSGVDTPTQFQLVDESDFGRFKLVQQDGTITVTAKLPTTVEISFFRDLFCNAAPQINGHITVDGIKTPVNLTSTQALVTH